MLLKSTAATKLKGTGSVLDDWIIFQNYLDKLERWSEKEGCYL